MSKMSTELEAVRYALHGATMGTRYSVIFYAAPTFDVQPLSEALFAAVDRVDRQMSTWKPASDLNRLNAAPVWTWVTLPRELTSVLDAALRIGQRSGGAFDIGIGDHVAAWGFGANAVTGAPLESGRRHVQQEARPNATCIVERGRARRAADVSLDLSGIAKGFGVDELGRVLNSFAVTQWLVGIDGDLRARGCKPDGSSWMIAHERPVPGIREAMGAIELHDQAVATSGTYRHFRKTGERTVSHTIDPRTNAPVSNAVASVTVLAATCMEADAWATAFLVMGPERALPLASVMGLDAIFVTSDGGLRTNLETRHTIIASSKPDRSP